MGVNSGTAYYTKLEHRLLLLAWLNNLFGYADNKALLQDCKEVDEGFAPDGHSHLYHHLLARGSKVRLPLDDLTRYDENIRQHLESINRGRPEPITLRYFQYLAVLYTEVVLDRVFNHRARFLAELNAFVAERNANKLPGEPFDEPFTPDDLTKLAFWMATGSGKTLIFHLNYYQYLHYNKTPRDNILLITPNEGLSEQHLRELALSGIPARRFDPNQSGMYREPNEVQVLEITKLVEEKRGGGVSVPVEAFEGRNLIFVDEGHKGAGGEAWRGYRDALGQTGFTFEYSATFGQALSAAKDDALTREYGKAIVFDYSYRYFYADGFGKDFRILNLRDDADEEKTALLLLGNLLSFYEQLRFYEEHEAELRPYNLEKPLWVFVGSKVNAVYTEKGKKRSDVLTVARFLHQVLHDRGWTTAAIKNLLAGKSGLKTADGADVFLGRFPYLKALAQTPANLYADILRRVFHARGNSGLHLADIRGSQGEIGLKAADADTYFGVIYIGDTATFKKLVESEAQEIALEEDAIHGTLFGDINQPDSAIHVLIGAKKFMEGWNSWRVSNMGLLNIGRSEGSQIIQLFGRGVRLKGKGMSLKRSDALPGPHPEHIHLLETLNIFAVRANYMAQFREYLEREGVRAEPVIELPLFTWINEPALKKELVIPRTPSDRQFADEVVLTLQSDASIRVRVDMSVKVEAMTSTGVGLHQSQVQAGQERDIPRENLTLVDWEAVYLDLMDYKARKGWRNLMLNPEALPSLFEQIRYTLIAEERVVQPHTFAERSLLQQAVTNILRKYMDAWYRRQRARWETQTIAYQTLDANDPNLAFNRERAGEEKAAYIVRVPQKETELIEKIRQLMEDVERLYREEDDDLPRIHFDGHLYLPLLLEDSDQLEIIPPGLNAGEARFVRDLKAFWEAEKDASLKGKEVYVLRNLSRGKSVGFFEDEGFYPDFILWVLDQRNHSQRIVFVEPHGMRHAKAYTRDDKARLHERLAEITRRLSHPKYAIVLDAWIISTTPYEELREYYGDGTWNEDRFAEAHILFFPRHTYEYRYLAPVLAPSLP